MIRIDSTKKCVASSPRRENTRRKLRQAKARMMEKMQKQTTEANERAEGNSSNTDYDQDSDVSFMKDTDEEIDTAEIEEEAWI